MKPGIFNPDTDLKWYTDREPLRVQREREKQLKDRWQVRIASIRVRQSIKQDKK